MIQRWLQTRPGCGWRSDIYGTAARAEREQVVRGRLTTTGERGLGERRRTDR